VLCAIVWLVGIKFTKIVSPTDAVVMEGPNARPPCPATIVCDAAAASSTNANARPNIVFIVLVYHNTGSPPSS